MRFGRIQKYLLTWQVRFHAFRGTNLYLSKSGAILSFARNELGYSINPRPKSVKLVLPPLLYKNLHVSFRRALLELEKKGLVICKSRSKILAEDVTQVEASGLFSKSQLTRRDTYYTITELGHRVGSDLLKDDINT